MGEFFQGWRRKIGLVTLLMACGLTGVWFLTSQFSFHIATAYVDPVQFLTAKDGYLRWAVYPGITISEPVTFRVGRPNHVELDAIESEGMQKDLVWKWHWAWGGFEFGNSSSRNLRVWAIPFSAIVIPLTLLSAYLLLTKPRQPTSKKITEPRPTEGS